MPLQQLQERPLITERNLTNLVQGTSLILGQQNRVRLPLGTTFQALRLRLSGSLVVATGAGTIREDAPINLLKSIDLLLGGGQPLRVHDARAVRVLNQIQHNSAPRLTAPGGSIGTTTFNAELYVDLWQPDLLYGLPRKFWMDARFISAAELLLTVGDAIDMIAPGAGTDTLTGVNLGIDLVEVLNRGGLLSRMQVLRQIVQPVAATGVLDIAPFAGAGVIYRGFLLHATSGNADPNQATSDDTIITDVTVAVSGGLRLADAIPWERLRGETKRVYNLESIAAGWALVDFAKEHHLDDIVDTNGEQNVTMRFTIGAAPANSFIQIYPLVVLKRKKKAAA